ncbi:Zinc import ATP-binding protein ZnuC [Bacteroidales bacterium Barb6XT]|nr:Zinc import ATP-binding protein ZnuC [Bacteroidales bacterium Barb6XT]
MNKRIELDGVSAGYGGKLVLHDVALDVWEDDFLGITGPNGGGKTTLLKVILGLIPPVQGSIRYFGEGGKAVSSLKIGYLPQINAIDRKFPISVREVVSSGLSYDKPLFLRFGRAQKERVEETLVQMGLESLAARPVGELSGGQLQRALLGRAIVSRPCVLILDEPNSYIDKRFEAHFLQMLEEINRESAVILVSHEMQAVLPLVKHLLHVDGTANEEKV